MLWIVDGGMISLPVVARVEDFKEDSYIEITGADKNHEWRSEPTRYEKVVKCKDCKYFRQHSIDDIKRCGFNHDGMCRYWNSHSTNFEWFCVNGERKEK